MTLRHYMIDLHFFRVHLGMGNETYRCWNEVFASPIPHILRVPLVGCSVHIGIETKELSLGMCINAKTAKNTKSSRVHSRCVTVAE